MEADLTRDEVMRRAHAVADAEGWPWREPVLAKRVRRWLFFGPIDWHVRTNANKRGSNVNIWISDASGEVTKKAFARR